MYKNADEQLNLRSMTALEISEVLKQNGIERYRGKQIFSWLYKHVDSFEKMTDIPKKHIEQLYRLFYIDALHTSNIWASQTDDTQKYLFTLDDGHTVESVSMKYEHGNSICVSSQVGCKMGCAFCASTQAGFVRNLRPSEMLLQLEYVIRDRMKTQPDYRISNVVIMGIGEPLDNYDAVVRFLRLINEPGGFGIGYRHISLSTCGLVPQIYRLAEEGMPITLSVSLHTPDNVVRSQLMPINHRYPIEELIMACKEYGRKNNRRISFEYALIQGVNDSIADARKLAKLLTGILCHVNLILINPIKERNFVTSTKQTQVLFVKTLEENHINVTIRRRLGLDIDAACGQLRKSHMN